MDSDLIQGSRLLDVQKTALERAEGKEGFAYFMEMGLGKTLTALTEFLQLVHLGKATRMVVICPNSFKAGWADEIRKHNLNLSPYVYNAGGDFYNNKWIEDGFEIPPVLIVNYEAIRQDHARSYIIRFVGQKDALLVLDESIQIKTYNALQTKAALHLSLLFKYKRILSGKPMSQGPHDLWAQLRAINAIRDNYFPFKTTFCKMGGFKSKRVVGVQNEEILSAKIDKYIFRASKAEWTDLPPKSYTSRQYDLTASLYNMYKSMQDEFVLWLNDTENVTVDTFITKYIKLAQIQSGFIIREDGTVAELVTPDKNPRFNLVREILEEVPGKAVIPYYHKYTLSILTRALADYDPAFIKGNMEAHDIEYEKKKFNNDAACRVILVQIRAGKYGHTLLGGEDVGDKCSTMIFAENSYSLDDRSQIEDRIHRHGQTQNCLYIDLWGTELDHRMTQALQAKEDIVQAVMQYFH